jgi:exopolysaccharide production protein ExoQ
LQQIATVLFVIGILGLFYLDRNPKARTSKALWIPIVWLLIAGSRNVGQWLEMSSPMDQGERYLEGNPLDRAVLSVLIAFGVMVLFTRRRRVVAILRANAPLVLFFGFCALSCLWSDYPDVALKRWFRSVGDIVMVLVILTDPDWLSALKRVLARVAFLLFPLSVLLIRYYPNLGRGYNKAGSAMYWTGVTTDKNGLGMICLIFGLGTVWRFIEIYQGREGEKQTRPLIAQGVLVATMIWLLWESNSMTSISCFVLAGGLMLATGRWAFARRPAVTTLLAAFAVGVSALVLFGGFGSVLQALGRNPTLTGRTEVWDVLLPFAKNPLFGTGYESFWLGERLVRIGDLTANGIQEAHNGYLEIYLNLGLVGITFLAILIITGFRKIVLAVRRDPASGKVRLAYFVLAVIYNFTEAAFKMMSPVWMFFLLAVMAVPKPALSEDPVTNGLYPAASFTAPKVQRAYAMKSGLRKEAR